MWTVTVSALLCALLGGIVFWARQDGKKAIHLKALKQEIREAVHVQNIKRNVDNMPLVDVRRRLYGKNSQNH